MTIINNIDNKKYPGVVYNNYFKGVELLQKEAKIFIKESVDRLGKILKLQDSPSEFKQKAISNRQKVVLLMCIERLAISLNVFYDLIKHFQDMSSYLRENVFDNEANNYFSNIDDFLDFLPDSRANIKKYTDCIYPVFFD